MCLIDLKQVYLHWHILSPQGLYLCRSKKKTHMSLDEGVSPKSLKGQHNPLFLRVINLPIVLKRADISVE